jgi:putative transposase
MRQPRLLQPHGDAFYHCVSRVVDRRFIFGHEEKEYFLRWMRKLEAFTGLQVVTYALMSNHFHLLVKVPDRASLAPLTPASLPPLLDLIYTPHQSLAIRQELDRALAAGDDAWTAQILARLEARRGDLSAFLKDLKQRFTQWFNRKNGRAGTLWEGRFKSVLVEGSEHALLTIAAYIDLNPVRAGLVSDPKDYRHCGYAEAVAGRRLARKGLATILSHTSSGTNRTVTWASTAPRYRELLTHHGTPRQPDPARGTPARRGMSQAPLTLPAALRCRVRYFTDGAALGSAAFVDEVFRQNRHRHGPRRTSGARKMQGADWGELRTLRDLRKNPFG